MSTTTIATPGTAAPRSTNPKPSDFSGTVTISPTATTTGQQVYVALEIRNITDHAVEPSNGNNPDNVGLVCTADLTPEGQTNQRLVFGENFWFVTNAPLDPGQEGGHGPVFYNPTAPGKITCEGVIIASPDHWQTVASVARLTNVAPAALTVT